MAWLLSVTTKQLMFIDEFMFNETTRWRHTMYVLINEIDRYYANSTRDCSWSVLLVYIVDNYLSCIAICKKWFNAKIMLRWILDKLLPHCNVFLVRRNIIVLNNASIHVNSRIEEIIKAHDCETWYLPSYSLDFNSIELSFNVLKT